MDNRTIRELLEEFGFGKKEVMVYLALLRAGEARASALAKAVDLPRTTVIAILEGLENKHAISSHVYRGVTYYWIEPLSALRANLEHKMDLAGQLDREFSKMYRTGGTLPSARVYDSKTAVLRFVEHLLTTIPLGSTIYTIDSPNLGNYSRIFGNDRERSFYTLKRKRNLTTQTLIPFGSMREIPPHKLTEQKITIRELPRGINYESSLWIVGNTVVHFSGFPPFAVALEHEKIVTSTKSLFRYLWDTSTPLTNH